MTFPSSVISDLVSGIPGEIAFDTPYVGGTAIINTDTASNNVFGRALTYRDESIESVQAGGTGLFAGLLVNPKGFADNTLAATADTVPNSRTVEFCTRGEVFVLLTAGTSVTIGDGVYFVNATGALGAGAATTGQTQITGATVVRHNPSAANAPSLAVVRLA